MDDKACAALISNKNIIGCSFKESLVGIKWHM